LIEGIMGMMATPDDVIGPVNLGNPSEFTILELAENVIRLTGSSSRIVFNPLPQDDPTQRRPDISKAKDLLCWTPGMPLADGLVKTIQYFKGALNSL